MMTKSRWVSWRMASALLALPLLGTVTMGFARAPSITTTIATSPTSSVYSSPSPLTSSTTVVTTTTYSNVIVGQWNARMGTVYLREGSVDAGWIHMETYHGWSNANNGAIEDLVLEPLTTYRQSDGTVINEGDYFDDSDTNIYCVIKLAINPSNGNIKTAYVVYQSNGIQYKTINGESKSQIPTWVTSGHFFY